MVIVPRDPNERINDLERDLYSRDAAPITTKKRPDLSEDSSHERHAQYGWKEQAQNATSGVAEVKGPGVFVGEKTLGEELAEFDRSERKSSLATKVFLASVLFFVVSAGIAAYIILGGFNIISSKNVDISVQGLVAVAAGEPLSLDILVKNNNNSTLDSGTMYVEYPEGTRMADDVTKELTRDQIDFDVVPTGGLVTKTIKPVFFGEKDSVKQIKIRVDYKARGSNASFSKEKTFDITIKSSPILMTVDVPKEVNAGQDIAITVDVASNSNTLINDLLVRVEYPFGFSFTGATPEPTFGQNVWRVGDLSPKANRTITIRGKMEGQNEEERTFRFSTGTASDSDEKQLAISYITSQASLFIKKAFIGLSLELNGKVGERVVAPGERVQGTLVWSNNLPVAINDASIQVKLSGKGLDRSQVTAGSNGFYRSIDNIITWDKNSVPALRNIEPGESGAVTFMFSVLPSSQQLLSQGRDLNIVLDATANGTRVQSDVPQQVQSKTSGIAKIGTNLTIAGRTVHSIGAFNNSGPIPPRVEKETTYTIVWNVSNSFNDVANAALTTQLPPYVRWLGKVSPTSEQVSYNDSTRTVSWNIPIVPAGVGYTAAAKEVSFQVALLPSLSQVRTIPDLTGPLMITGVDRFSGATIQSNKPALNTRLTNDPDFGSGDDQVVQ